MGDFWCGGEKLFPILRLMMTAQTEICIIIQYYWTNNIMTTLSAIHRIDCEATKREHVQPLPPINNGVGTNTNRVGCIESIDWVK